MSTHKGSHDRRSAPRVAVSQPVYIQRNVDGLELSLLVENLSAAGAQLICPELSEPFQSGQDFGDCVLVLPGVGHVPVKLAVRWAMWPKVGVEFTKISKQARQQINQFLNSVAKLSLNQSIIVR
jgi:c-di-GMP-binding flagellar brake protein YcgR